MQTLKRGDKYYYLNEFFQIKMRKFTHSNKDYLLLHVYNCFLNKKSIKEAQFEFLYSLKQYNE